MKMLYLTIFISITILLNSCGKTDEEIALEKKRIQDSIEKVIESAKETAVEEAQQKAESEKRLAEQAEWERKNKKFNVEDLVGTWNVKMSCINSNCQGTNVGDIRSETWYINYEGGRIIVKVSGNSTTNTLYTGTFDGKILKLHYDLIKTGLFKDKTVSVIDATLRMDSPNELIGKRKVLNDGPCNIDYNISLTK